MAPYGIDQDIVRRTRNHDIRRVLDMYLEGRSQVAIAAELGINQQQVSHDIAVIGRYWRMSAVRDFDAAKEIEKRKIDHLEETYWQAYHASLARSEETTERRTSKAGTTDMARVRKLALSPSMQALAGVQWCIDRRIRLMGLDAPTTVTIDMVQAEALRYAQAIGATPEEIIAEVARIVDAVRIA